MNLIIELLGHCLWNIFLHCFFFSLFSLSYVLRSLIGLTKYVCMNKNVTVYFILRNLTLNSRLKLIIRTNCHDNFHIMRIASMKKVKILILKNVNLQKKKHWLKVVCVLNLKRKVDLRDCTIKTHFILRSKHRT